MAPSLKTSTLVAALVLAASTGPGSAVAEGRQQPINDDYALLVDESDALPLGPAKSVGQARLGPAFVRRLRRLAGLSPFDPHDGGVQVQATFVSQDTDAHVDHLPPDATGTRRAVPRGERVGFWPVGVAAHADAAASPSEPPSYLDLLGRAQDGGARCLPIVPDTLVAFEGSLPHRTVTSKALRLLGPFHLETLSDVGISTFDPTTSPTTSPTTPAPTLGCTEIPFFTPAMFEALAVPPAQRSDVYTFTGFCEAVALYNEANNQTEDQIFQGPNARDELAAFLGNSAHETGCWEFTRETSQCGTIDVTPDGAGGKNVWCQPADGWEASAGPTNLVDGTGNTPYVDPYCSATGCTCPEEGVLDPHGCGFPSNELYFGRGSLQTSWNYNYEAASDALSYLDPNVDLCATPDLAATDEAYAWATGFWFWMDNGGGASSTSNQAVDSGSFGGTVLSINSMECDANAANAIKNSTVSRLDKYCKAVTTVTGAQFLSLDECDGLQDLLADCTSADPQHGACENCDPYKPAPTPPPTNFPTGQPTTPVPTKAPVPPTPPPTNGPTTRSPTPPPTPRPTNVPTPIQGCAPAYTSGGNYMAGSYVSYGVTETSTITEPCDYPEDFGCPNTGWRVETVTEMKYYNYQCDEAFYLYCNDASYAPGGLWESLAWIKQGVCSMDPGAPQPMNDSPQSQPWEGGGCPAPFTAAASYGTGDVVEVDGIVYKCKNANPAPGKFCSMAGYEPGNSLYWSVAWDVEGTCVAGAEVAVSAMGPQYMEYGGACPEKFSTSEAYGGGDTVTVYAPNSDIGKVYRCKNDLPAPGKFCDMVGYEPETSLYWEVAWDYEGTCSGTIQPTSRPSFDILAKCPDEYKVDTWYQGGDEVAVENVVFECKGWPYSEWCGLPGYEPNGSQGYWEYAWTEKGMCSGTITTLADAATRDSSYTPGRSIGDSCADAGIATYATGNDYAAGERVAVCNYPWWCQVFQCASDSPNPSNWCGQVGYEPLEGKAWPDAWTEVGYCTVTATPTAGPSVSLKPSIMPSPRPSASSAPSFSPSVYPTELPSESPSFVPSFSPSVYPTEKPSESPSTTQRPSVSPTGRPSASSAPSETTQPSPTPSDAPSTTSWPTTSAVPSVTPTFISTFWGSQEGTIDALEPNIPSGEGSFEVTFDVARACSVSAVTVTVRVDHEWVGDLTMTLTSPAGTVVGLVSRPGPTDQGSSAAVASTNPITFDDSSATPAQLIGDGYLNGDVFPGGSFASEGPTTLSDLSGDGTQGEWTFTISDDFAPMDGGTLVDVDLNIAASCEGTLDPLPAPARRL